jgi:Type III restriction enzyme, res subunit
MSLRYTLSELSHEEKLLVRTITTIPPDEESLEAKEVTYCFETDGHTLLLPMGMGKHLTPTKLMPMIHTHAPIGPESAFTGELTEEQIDTSFQAVETLTKDTYGTCFLELPTGRGKTCLSVYLSVCLGVKTVFLCHLDCVRKQTVKEFAKFSTLKVHSVKGKVLDPDADVYIIGLRKAHNLWITDHSVFTEIGLVIIDEAHLCHRFTFMELMFCFHPRYLVGMSATPIWNEWTSKYFEDPITKFSTKPFVVEKVVTPFTPDTSKKIYFGGRKRIDWTHAMTSLAENQNRNSFIIELILKHAPAHKLLVLCGRVTQCKYLYESLMKKGVDCDLLVGKKSEYRPECNVLVGGVKKIGVGFNDPTRTCLVLCFDLADIRQSEGRIRTSDNLVLDLVDNNYTLQQHWRKRRAWYEKRGATIVESEPGVEVESEEEHSPSVELRRFLFREK